jgi:hemerythrin-like metal-binding protein
MNDQYKSITWVENMLTGVASIDEQHQILVNMLNMAAIQLTAGSSRLQIEEIIRDLMSYALYHFDTEEELMVANAYPLEAQNKHFEEHRNFSATVAQLQSDIKQGKLITREELLSFLKGWLISHILDTDKQLGKFLLASELRTTDSITDTPETSGANPASPSAD